MPAPHSYSHPWRSLTFALPTAVGVPLICLHLWAMAIAANPTWRGGLFYFPTTFPELMCLIAFLISACPFLVTMLIGVGFIIPLLHSVGLGDQQIVLPRLFTAAPMPFDSDFVISMFFAGIVQIIVWMIVIERIRSKAHTP